MTTRRQFIIVAAAAATARPAAAEAPLDMLALYHPDKSFTPYAREREGTTVTVAGFMAPPLMAEARFFVQAMRPMSSCPFCDVESDWPEDIIAVYAKRVVAVVAFYKPIETRGVLRLGAFLDPDTSFVSQARIEDATYRAV